MPDLLLLLLLLAVPASASPVTPVTPVSPVSPVSPVFRVDQHPGTPEQQAAGAQVYAQCASCHGAQAEGRPGFAPRLASDDLLSVVGDDFLRRTIAEGRTGTQMPAWKDRLTPAEIDSVVAWIRQSQTSDGVVLDEGPLSGSVEAGGQAFSARCASCHGPRGEGMAASWSAPAIGSGPFLSQVDDPTLRALIRTGRSGTAMPAFPEGAGGLSDAQLDGIIAWLRANAWEDLPWFEAAAPAESSEQSARDVVPSKRKRPSFGALPDFFYDPTDGASIGLDLWLAGEGAVDWSLDVSTYVGVRPGADGAPELSYQDYSLGLSLDGLAKGRLGLSIGGGYHESTGVPWYGVGHLGAYDEEREERQPGYYEYSHRAPWANLGARVTLLRTPRGFLETSMGAALAWDMVSVPKHSLLAEDLAHARAGPSQGLLMVVGAGLTWDGTDDERDPTSGLTVSFSGRAGGSRLTTGAPGSFGGANGVLRAYLPAWAGRLVLATRAQADLQWGDVPFHRLSGQGLSGSQATGGGGSIRGVWGDRRAGKVKLLSNVELRLRVVDFEFFGLPIGLGVVGFVDAGRVWADFVRDAQLDGDGLLPAVGMGFGGRVHLGEEFMLRLDLGWSPTDGTDGFYMGFGHAF